MHAIESILRLTTSAPFHPTINLPALTARAAKPLARPGANSPGPKRAETLVKVSHQGHQRSIPGQSCRSGLSRRAELGEPPWCQQATARRRSPERNHRTTSSPQAEFLHSSPSKSLFTSVQITAIQDGESRSRQADALSLHTLPPPAERTAGLVADRGLDNVLLRLSPFTRPLGVAMDVHNCTDTQFTCLFIALILSITRTLTNSTVDSFWQSPSSRSSLYPRQLSSTAAAV